MSKKIAAGCALLLGLTLTACSSQPNSQPDTAAPLSAVEPQRESNTQNVSEPGPGTQPVEPADRVGDEVVVERWIPFEEPRALGVLKQPEDLEAFRDAFRTADRLSGELEVSSPDYRVRFPLDGEVKELYAWIDYENGPGMLMETSDMSTGYTVNAESNRALREKIGGIVYDSEQAEQNGDIVSSLRGTVANLDTWQDFVQHIETGQPDSVQRVGYTIEGDPIFDNLNYDGKEIRYVHDNSLDAYGRPDKQIDTCERIAVEPLPQKRGGPGKLYRLDGCASTGGGQSEYFWFPVPDSALK
ncbi:DUF4362 domain-containing protein [Saccharibacillus sp. CPCC 101409]|uniref:DUF4362 domain-containing protein n=1 Tax=Saccharibacillus sp. CPCC 101409 TaxID=3058041 RepID=UPI0026720E02|nr:DUF4362 domain-containing protein [Saccharibacillus sp. CPCC 101409]MDO3412536.1 DUF4362 domain-containing protein [Saccharibacillus sp. CPCC 101409]